MAETETKVLVDSLCRGTCWANLDCKKAAARIKADAEVIKAAEELAGLDCADVIEKALQESAIADKWAWVFEDTLTELQSALAAFHRAKQRQAAILRSYEVPANEARMDALWDVAQNDPDPNGDVTVGKIKLRTDGGEER